MIYVIEKIGTIRNTKNIARFFMVQKTCGVVTKKRGAKPNRIKVTKPDGSATIYESKHVAAKALGVTKRTMENYMHRGTGRTTQSPFYGWKVESLPPLVNVYALYIKGELVHTGTLSEIAKAQNSTVYRIKAYLYDTQDRYLNEVKLIGEKEAE